MSRFVSPDLSKLNVPDIVELPSHSAGLKERMAAFQTKAAAVGVTYNTGDLLTDPIRLDQDVSMDREIQIQSRINDAARSVSLATAWGNNLDHIGATYYGITRLDSELDDDFRARIALAPEAFSTAGPEGAYIFHALELDGRRAISDAACYSEEDGALYSNGAPVLAPEVLVVIVPSIAWLEDQDAWATPAPLVALAYEAVANDDVRPIGDKVSVMVAQRQVYHVEAALKFAPGADQALALAEAETNLRAYAKEQRRAGGVAERLGIGAALKVAGVKSIDLTSPEADVDPGSLGCPDLGDVTLTAVTDAEGWR